jgi:Family of unknown function (DUF6188)
MTAEVNELPDRWVLPVQGKRITRMDWDDLVRFELDPPGEIAVGSGAVFTRDPSAAPGAGEKTLAELGRAEVERVVGAGVLSVVGFTSGALQVVLDNGWHLIVRPEGVFVPASVTLGDSVTWTRDEPSEPSAAVG